MLQQCYKRYTEGTKYTMATISLSKLVQENLHKPPITNSLSPPSYRKSKTSSLFLHSLYITIAVACSTWRVVVVTNAKEKSGNASPCERSNHQNHKLRLSTAFMEVYTSGILPNSATNRFTQCVLFSVCPPMLLIPVEPISYILPTKTEAKQMRTCFSLSESYYNTRWRWQMGSKSWQLPLTHIGGAFVAFAMRNDIAISSQFL